MKTKMKLEKCGRGLIGKGTHVRVLGNSILSSPSLSLTDAS